MAGAGQKLERRDSFAILRDTMRWRVAVVLAALIMVLMVALAALNTQLGLRDTATLAWGILAATGACMAGLLMLPRRLGGTVFFVVITAILVGVPAYGLEHGRSMQHWAYIFPPLVVFLLRAGPSLAAMLVYGIYTTIVTAQLLPAIEVVRFASGYGLLVCFMYTYALLQERAAAMLRYHSDHDALSNCYNRRTFNESLEQVAREGKGCTFLLIDIDHFKQINDQHGHLVGDRIITQVAAALGRALDAGTLLFRYGGEEFAVMRIGDDERDGAALAERLRTAISDADFQGIRVTVSIGVAEWRAAHGTVDQALGRADRALYMAKRAGRNRVVADSVEARAA